MIKKLTDIIAPCFYEVHMDVMKHGHDTYRLKGGRGSTKSSYVSAEILNLIMKFPFACAAVFMKQQNRLRKGVFAQFMETIARLGVEKYFKPNMSTMTITYLPTGQQIMFFGLDDPFKTKSLNTGNPNTYFAISWFEELDQFSGIGEIDTALESVVRGGDIHWCFQTYNPPDNRNNWCNRDSLKNIRGRLVHHSDYRYVPEKWLGKAFYDKMRNTRLRSEREYRWRYLGEATGTGGSVFENIRDITITSDMLTMFDNHYNGQDWGYFPDPAAFVRWHYDVAEDSLYCCAESIKNKSSYTNVARDIINNSYNDVYTILDSARGEEMLSAFQAEGVLAQNMYKGRSGQLSREFGIQWLQTRKNIYIDKNLTPKTYEEFVSYEYQKDLKTGEFTGNVISFNDHTIDATRYALSPYYQVYGDYTA
jgi:PBSX family phage terminase large subunit